MGLPWSAWFVVATVWCMPRIYGYTIERPDDRTPPINLELDFFSGDETNKFLESSDSFEDPMLSSNLRNFETTRPPVPGTASTQKRMYLFFVHNDNYTGAGNDSTPLDSWSVVWYIASFGGLIVFFLIVSCSEWCCRRALRNSQNCNRNAPTTATPSVPDTPPPSYDQFAPPSYDSICLGRSGRGGEKNEYDIYVVPVHTLGTLVESRQEDAPPSYLSASERNFVPALTRLDSQVARVT